MKTKTVKVSVSIKGDEISVVKHLLELLSDEEEVLFTICGENLSENEMKAYYLLGNLEANGTFIDKDICENYQKVLLYALKQNKMYNCTGKVVDFKLDSTEWIAHFFLEVPLLLSEDEKNEDPVEDIDEEYEAEDSYAPELPYAPQEFKPKPTLAEKQKYDIRIVGVQHHTSPEIYQRMVKLSQEQGFAVLRCEEDNEKDPLAVAAYLESGEKVGYVASQYLAVVQPEVKKNGELPAKVTYMEYQGSTATALMEFESDTSIMAVHLFSRYAPIEVYRANYLYGKWGGIFEEKEKDIMSETDQLIHFNRFFELSINNQNRIADHWYDRMRKATVENPTNRGGRMSVPLDLSVYGTSWIDFDLKNTRLINKIESDNKIMAQYFRFRRTESHGMAVTPKEFMDKIIQVKAGKELMERLSEVFDKQML